MSVWFKGVTGAQAHQASELYDRQGWTQKDVGEAMGWHPGKVAKIVRNYRKHGQSIFANDRKAPEALRARNHGPSCERMERATGRGAGASEGNGAAVPGIGVGE